MFRFLFPGFLIGLAAASIPIIIHLINRRKAIIHEFSAIELVLRSHRRVARRFKLKQLLLLIVRSTMIACLSLALAKPFYSIFGSMAEGDVAPSSNVILVDRSMSMRWTPQVVEGVGGTNAGAGTLFERAKEEARQLIAQMKDTDEALVAFCSGRTRGLNSFSEAPRTSSGGPGIPQFTSEKRLLFQMIEKAGQEASFKTTDAIGYLSLANELLVNASNPIKQIFFITDMTKNGWESPEEFSDLQAEIRQSGAAIRIIDVSKGAPMKNLAVSDVTIAQQAGGSDRDFTVRAKIRNFSDESCENVLCEVFVERKPIARGFVDVKPHSSASKEFSCRLPSGGVLSGYVQIKADHLPADDRRHFLISAAADVRALVVDGDPRTVSHEAETFYLERALNPALPRSGVSSHIKPTIVTVSEFDSLSSGRLEDFGVVFLCNVKGLSSRQVSRLRGYVQRGGGLFLSVGDQVDAFRYRDIFGDLLPQELKEVRDRGLNPKSPEARPLRIEDFPSSHPVLKIFNEPSAADETERRFGKVRLSSANFFKTFLLRPASRGARDTILKYDDGSAALVEKSFGKGKVILFTSTIDRDWNDFPIQTTFLPLIQQITRYLSRTMLEADSSALLVGQPKEISIGEGASLVKIIDPRGVTISADAGALRSAERVPGREAVVFRHTDRPGIYRVLLRAKGHAAIAESDEPGEYFQKYFVVNLDTRESDLSKISEREVMDSLSSEGDTNVVVLTADDHAQAAISEQRYDIWGYLLFAVLVWLTLESLIAWTM